LSNLRKSAILHHPPGPPAGASAFDIQCRRCARLAEFRDQIKQRFPAYYASPVPPFGATDPDLLIVGLAPGLHGANRTGRPFTGDFAGILLYKTLFKYGFSSKDHSLAVTDSLRLRNCAITNAVKCVPPQNKPTPQEISTCNYYLASELRVLPEDAAILALGRIAHQAVLQGFALKRSAYPFAHAAVHALPGRPTLFDSYHCSRYNTQTNRLTVSMFEAVVAQIRQHIDSKSPKPRQ
jgi:uracil-DNA glycosylase